MEQNEERATTSLDAAIQISDYINSLELDKTQVLVSLAMVVAGAFYDFGIYRKDFEGGKRVFLSLVDLHCKRIDNIKMTINY